MTSRVDIGVDDFESAPVSEYGEEGTGHKANGHDRQHDTVNRATEGEATKSPERIRNAAMCWDDLEGKHPPAREWVYPHWIPASHSTLLAGRGGIGKTLLGQHMGTAVALGCSYMESLQRRRVLMWAGEDDLNELWRRQVNINRYFQRPLADLTEWFFLHSYAGADITLAGAAYGSMVPTLMLDELRQQVGDYRAELVILDNSARIFGASENDRHAVTTFMAWLQNACAPAAILLLSHPSKAIGSEFSGSTAWEGAVRSRLYMSDRPPDADVEDDAPVDDSVRYLSRRKANYSALDLRRFTLADGVLVPEEVKFERTAKPSGEFAKDIVRRAVRTLAERGMHGTVSTASPDYLPKLAMRFKLLETLQVRAFATIVNQMLMERELSIEVVGKYQNRTPKKGIVLPLDEVP